MKKNLIYILLSFTFFVNLFAKEIDEKKAYQFVNDWLSKNEFALHYGKNKRVEKKFILKSIKAVRNNFDEVSFYVAELEPIGFILLSKDNRLKPVIGYSSEHDFNYERVEEDVFLNIIISDLNANLKRIEKANITAINSEWTSVKNSIESATEMKEEIYGPFLQSDWGQGYVRGNPVYNYYTPNKWPAGCVATATAQILNYYKWPYQGYGSHGYFDDGQFLFANFEDTFYDWANTLDLYTDQYFTLDNQKAAGLLTYHCAVALNMDFEYNGSTASTTDVPNILHNYFRASGHYKDVSDSGFWDELKNNMLDERPAIISIKSTSHSIGHAAVVDGYFETNNYYHVNPGWYGDYTGWYNISGSWNMSGYDIVVGAAKGIVPSPQINNIERLSENSFIVSWRTSRHQNADYYELQQARSLSGPWVTLSDNIVDTTYQINNAELGSYYYKVRAYRDNIWWDYSTVKKVQLGTVRGVTFLVDMTYRSLGEDDTLVIRGNIPPLTGNSNSDPMVKIDSSNIYKLTLNFDYDYVGTTILYRFFIQSKDGLIAEQKNREYVLTSEPSQVLPVVYFDDYVSVEDKENIPSKFKLEQNYPNPFNPSTTIKYSIPAVETTRHVFSTLKIYDILGHEVAVLVNKEQTPGNYSVTFTADNLSTGVYIYQLRVGQLIETKKMILIK